MPGKVSIKNKVHTGVRLAVPAMNRMRFLAKRDGITPADFIREAVNREIERRFKLKRTLTT